MNMTSDTAEAAARFEVLYRSLFDEGRGVLFPCDCDGKVVLDDLSERARNNYFYVRALVGRDFAWPEVRRIVQHP